MKKLFLTFCYVVGFILIPSLYVVAAGFAAEQVFGVESIEDYFISLAALSGAVLPVTEFIKRLFKASGGWVKFLSWIVAVALAFVGWWLNMGMLEGLSVLWVVIYGFAAGLVANSVFDIGIIQTILSALKGIVKK